MKGIKKGIFILTSIFLLGLFGCSDREEGNNSLNEEQQEMPSEENKGEENMSEPENDQNNEENDSALHEENDDEGGVGMNILEGMEDLSIAVLVNKQYGLSEEDVPDDLITVEVPTVLDNPEIKQLRQGAAEALYDLFVEAKKEGFELHARSGYRSYATQVQLFNGYAEKHGEEAANRYSAKPGHSEHQTGLVMDITSESVNFQLEEEFGETEEGKWVKENAHKSGFIIRYPEDKEDITGYIYEPWHLRYLGIDLATAVYESGLTYEEYLDKEGIIDEVNAEKVNKTK